MIQYKAIIFDMDGTIIDTDFIWEESNKLYLKKIGIAQAKELNSIYDKIRGLNTKQSSKILKDLLKLEENVEKIEEDIRKLSHSTYEKNIKKVKFISGFEHFHEKTQKKNIPTAIATNATSLGVKLADKMLNLKKYFGEHIYDMSHVNYIGKPSPDIYLYAAKQLGINPKECIAFEDTPHGANAAISAGMYCIAIDTADLKEKLSNAHLVINKYEEFELDKFF
jgi:HAD superfamily hydrolase (TIGR01509 family)